MKAYRLERDGVGPFAVAGYDGFEAPDSMDIHNIMTDEWDNSAMDMDCVSLVTFDEMRIYKSACTDPQTLRDYFEDAFYALLDCGFEVVEYDLEQSQIHNTGYGFIWFTPHACVTRKVA